MAPRTPPASTSPGDPTGGQVVYADAMTIVAYEAETTGRLAALVASFFDACLGCAVRTRILD